MSEIDPDQYTLILKSVSNQKQYSLYCSRDDRLSDVATFLLGLEALPDVRNEEQFAFKINEGDSPIPQHETIGKIGGLTPTTVELFVELRGKNGKKSKDKSCCRTF